MDNKLAKKKQAIMRSYSNDSESKGMKVMPNIKDKGTLRMQIKDSDETTGKIKNETGSKKKLRPMFDKKKFAGYN